MRRLSPILALVATALFAPAARAEVVSLAHLPLDGPRLADGDLVWADETPASGIAVLASPTGGGTIRTLGTIPALAYTKPGPTPFLAASERRVALEVLDLIGGKPGPNPFALRSFDGPLGGGLAERWRCELYSGAFVSPGPTAVDGDVVAARGPACPRQSPEGVTVTDHATDPPASVELSDAGGVLGLSGRYLAYGPLRAQGDEPFFIVRDWRAGQELYRITDEDAAGPGFAGRRGFDLQEDGKIAYSLTLPNGDVAVAWHSAQHRQPQVVALPASSSAVVKWAGTDRLLVLRRPVGAHRSAGVLELRGLDGALIRTIAADAWTVGAEPVDADGERAAYITRHCNGVELRVESLSREAPATTSRAHCPLRLASPLRERSRRLVAQLDCRGFSTVCVARNVRVTARIRGRRRPIAHPEWGALYGRLEVSLLPAGRKLFRRRSNVRVRVTLTYEKGERRIHEMSERRTGSFTVR